MKKIKQPIEEITYPIAKESTTVGGVLKRLRLTKGAAMHKAIKEGRITINGQPVKHSFLRVYPHQTLGWYEYRIRLVSNEEAKRMRLTTELFRAGGIRGGFPSGNMGVGGGSFSTGPLAAANNTTSDRRPCRLFHVKHHSFAAHVLCNLHCVLTDKVPTGITFRWGLHCSAFYLNSNGSISRMLLRHTVNSW